MVVNDKLLGKTLRWISEKMDGVRGYWDGKKLLSRSGNRIVTPPWFVEGLPEFQLDGELWMGKGSSNYNITSVIQSKHSEEHWKNIGYYIYDAPSFKETYDGRMKILKSLQLLPPHIHIVDNIECKGRNHLLTLLEEVITAKGEGLMARNPFSQYTAGLVASLLKVKVIPLIC